MGDTLLSNSIRRIQGQSANYIIALSKAKYSGKQNNPSTKLEHVHIECITLHYMYTTGFSPTRTLEIFARFHAEFKTY